MSTYRSSEVDSWINMDMKISYNLSESTTISVVGKNILNNEQFLIKNQANPFDYRREMRRVSIELLVDF